MPSTGMSRHWCLGRNQVFPHIYLNPARLYQPKPEKMMGCASGDARLDIIFFTFTQACSLRSWLSRDDPNKPLQSKLMGTNSKIGTRQLLLVTMQFLLPQRAPELQGASPGRLQRKRLPRCWTGQRNRDAGADDPRQGEAETVGSFSAITADWYSME